MATTSSTQYTWLIKFKKKVYVPQIWGGVKLLTMCALRKGMFHKILPRDLLKSQLRSTRKVFVNKILVNPIHTIFKYGKKNMIYGAVLKSSSQWQLKEF